MYSDTSTRPRLTICVHIFARISFDIIESTKLKWLQQPRGLMTINQAWSHNFRVVCYSSQSIARAREKPFKNLLERIKNLIHLNNSTNCVMYNRAQVRIQDFPAMHTKDMRYYRKLSHKEKYSKVRQNFCKNQRIPINLATHIEP